MKKNNFGYKIYSTKTIKELETKLNLLGKENKYSVIRFLNTRTLICVVIFILCLYLTKYNFVISIILTFIAHEAYIPLVVDTKIKDRKFKIEKEAPYFFEVLAISLESGRNIKTALEITTNNIDSALSDEFKQVVKDMTFGKDLDEALEDLKHRIPSDTINNIILNIRQSNIFGNNIINTIYSEIDYLREKRLLETKGEISKIPVKISVISVLFFIPLLLLLLLGPLLIDLL